LFFSILILGFLFDSDLAFVLCVLCIGFWICQLFDDCFERSLMRI
jgi:hypothetical protein